MPPYTKSKQHRAQTSQYKLQRDKSKAESARRAVESALEKPMPGMDLVFPAYVYHQILKGIR